VIRRVIRFRVLYIHAVVSAIHLCSRICFCTAFTGIITGGENKESRDEEFFYEHSIEFILERGIGKLGKSLKLKIGYDFYSSRNLQIIFLFAP
jgi:hypothetical protein